MTECSADGVEDQLNRLEELMGDVGSLLLDNRSRLDRAEELLVTVGKTLQEASALAQNSAIAIDRLTKRVDSLAASGERHDRILDYLIGRDANGGASQN